MNLFYDVVVPYLTTPRHVTRLINAISVSWPPMRDNVSRADFLAMETLRLYEPSLFMAIRQHRDLVTDASRGGSRDAARFEPFLAGVAEARRPTAEMSLKRLFPAFEEMSYSGFNASWDAERRVCLSKHFDTYFKLTLSADTLSAQEIEVLLARADDGVFIQERLQRAALQTRQGGKSMVPVVLDELTSHAGRIDREKVTGFFSALFEVADAIDREEDAERGFGVGNTFLRYHWLIRRVTENRFTLEEQSEVYLAATEHAALGWLVDFVSSAYNDHYPPEGKQVDLATALTTREALGTLVARALGALHEAARTDTLLQSRQLMYCLYRWREFASDGGAEMKAWLSDRMQRDEVLVILAKALTGESWAAGMGGFGDLGDRVSRRHVRAQISENFDLFDPAWFRSELERVMHEGTEPTEDLQAVKVFLEAWNKGERSVG